MSPPVCPDLQQSLSDRAPSPVLSMPATEPTEDITMATAGDAASDQEVIAGDAWVQRVRRKRRVILEGCICGEVVLGEEKESGLVLSCKAPGCETVWVSLLISDLTYSVLTHFPVPPCMLGL
jgi:hypothetical protein